MLNPIPNPGSDEAIAQGCWCPVLDNAHSKGYMGIEGIFVYTEGCPVHHARLPENGPIVLESSD